MRTFIDLMCIALRALLMRSCTVPSGQIYAQNSLLNSTTAASRAMPIITWSEDMLQGRLLFARYVARAWRPPIGQYASGSTASSEGMRPVMNTTRAISTPHWRRYLGQFVMIVDFLDMTMII